MELLVPIVLLASGLAAGVMMWTQLGGWPLLASLPPDRYVATHAFFATRFDPFMPACMLLTLGGDVALGVLAAGAAMPLFLSAAVLSAGAITISLLRNVPVNSWIRSLDPADLPADFPAVDPRRSWGAWNRVRAALTVCAFVANCAALSLLI